MVRRARRKVPGVSFEAVLPLPVNTDRMIHVLHNVMLRSAKEMLQDFEKGVRTWKNPPKMDVRVGGVGRLLTGKAELDMDVGPRLYDPNYDKYKFVDLGTKRHRIPKAGNTGAKPLYFQWGGPGSYKAKTKPRRIGSTAGGATGPMVVFKRVMHPGTKARQFSSMIARKWQKKLPKEAGKAMAKAAQVSGHSMARR